MHVWVTVIHLKKPFAAQWNHIFQFNGPHKIGVVDMREHDLPRTLSLGVHRIERVLHHLGYTISPGRGNHFFDIDGTCMNRLTLVGVCDLFSLHDQEFVFLFK
jgi:hypothetical protein